VGNDPRENRYFNILSQAKRYDGKGEYVKFWLPELKKVPAQLVHQAGDLRKNERDMYNIGSFPLAVVSAEKWEKG